MNFSHQNPNEGNEEWEEQKHGNNVIVLSWHMLHKQM